MSYAAPMGAGPSVSDGTRGLVHLGPHTISSRAEHGRGGAADYVGFCTKASAVFNRSHSLGTVRLSVEFCMTHLQNKAKRLH